MSISTISVFPHVMKMTQALLNSEIDGALVDNYVISYFLNLISDEPIRVEKYIEHGISYGVGLTSNSSQLEKCMRYFVKNYPQEVFEVIAGKLQPLRVRWIHSCLLFLSLLDVEEALSNLMCFSLYRILQMK